VRQASGMADRSPTGIIRLLLVILTLCMDFAGAVCLFYVFSPHQSAVFSGLPGDYNDGKAITFIIACITLAPILNVLAYFSNRMSLVLLSAGLSVSLAPRFIVQLGWVASCQNHTNNVAECNQLGADPNMQIALAGYCLLMFSVFFSFLVCPGKLRTFRFSEEGGLAHRVFLGIGFFVGTLSLAAAIIGLVQAADIQENGVWKPKQTELIATAVNNFIAVFFFYAALLIKNLPLGHATLFFLALYYPLPLLPALNNNTGSMEMAAGALGYTGVVLMAFFLIHRHFFSHHHHADGDEDPDAVYSQHSRHDYDTVA